MVIPVQQTPIPFDPARQQFTLPPPPEVPTPPRPADLPVQAADAHQDKFTPDPNGGGGAQRGQTDQDHTATVQKLQVAYSRLLQLEQEASAAVQSGDAGRAKEVASEAAGVAQFIQVTANSLPLSAINGMVAAAEQTEAQQFFAWEDRRDPGWSSAAAGDSGPATPPAGPPPRLPPDIPAALDTARAGLGTAKTVVEAVASLPYHPLPDRIAIDGMRRQVLDAMAGVEAIAAKFAAAHPSPPSRPSRHLDIKA